MKRKLTALTRRYQTTLQAQMVPGAKLRRRPARLLGLQAVRIGLETLDLARIHKTALTALRQPGGSPAVRRQMLQQAVAFFTEAITPIEETHRAGQASVVKLDRRKKTLTRRTAQLVVAKRQLKKGIVRRKTAQAALKQSGRHYTKLLRESHDLQRHLQRLTHQILSAQENERKKLSRELHDEIAQTLLGIHVRLLTLKKVDRTRNESLAKEIASTQRLVRQSTRTINRFSHEFGTQH